MICWRFLHIRSLLRHTMCLAASLRSGSIWFPRTRHRVRRWVMIINKINQKMSERLIFLGWLRWTTRTTLGDWLVLLVFDSFDSERWCQLMSGAWTSGDVGKASSFHESGAGAGAVSHDYQPRLVDVPRWSSEFKRWGRVNQWFHSVYINDVCRFHVRNLTDFTDVHSVWNFSLKHDTACGQEQRQQELPLLGTTFAVKDNLMVRSFFTPQMVLFWPTEMCPM